MYFIPKKKNTIDKGIMEWNTHASSNDPRNPGIRFMSGITKLSVQFDE